MKLYVHDVFAYCMYANKRSQYRKEHPRVGLGTTGNTDGEVRPTP